MAAANVASVSTRQGVLGREIAVVASRMAGLPGLKWVVGLFLFLVAGAVMLLALGCYFSNQSEGERGPREATADELRNLTSLNSLPDAWLSYSFPKSSETSVRLDTASLGNQQAYSQFILVPVEDCWLVAQVPPGFSGNKLVGKVERLGTWDGRTFEKNLDQKIIAQIKASNPDKANRILQYQVNAVQPYESKVRSGYMLAGGIAAGGLLVGGLGLTIIRAKPQPR
jgi:hypothetical protein